jgi:hypothetical protein
MGRRAKSGRAEQAADASRVQFRDVEGVHTGEVARPRRCASAESFHCVPSDGGAEFCSIGRTVCQVGGQWGVGSLAAGRRSYNVLGYGHRSGLGSCASLSQSS